MLSTLVKGSSIVFISQGIGAALGFTLQVCLARWMGASEYGFYTYVMAWATLGGLLSGLGFGPGLLRFVPEYKTIQDEPRLKGVLQGSLGVAIASGVIVATLATLIIAWLGLQPTSEQIPAIALPAWQRLQDNSQYIPAIIIGFWAVPFLTVNTLSMNMLRGIRKMTAAYVPSQVLRPALIVLGSFIIFAMRGYESLNSFHVLIATIVALIVVELIAGWQIHKHLPMGKPKVKAIYELRKWFRVSLPLLLISGFVKIIKQTDILMIGILLASADVGFYHAAAKTANLASFALSSVNGIAAPMIASTYAEGDPVKLQKLMTRITQLIFIPSFLMTVGVILLSGVVLGAFGEEFLQAQGVLTVLAIAQFIRATTGPVGHLLDLTGHQDESARVRATSAVLNIGLNLVGIHFFGILGAAIATAISIVVEKMWIDFLVKKYINVNGSLFSQVKSSLLNRDR
jgi:O-antigen/teichoic acid export membrane protein